MRPTELVITNPQWMPKEKTSGGVRNDPAHVRINPTSISIKQDAWQWMGSPDRIELGTADYKGDVILTMRPGDRGHKLVNPLMTFLLPFGGLSNWWPRSPGGRVSMSSHL